MFSRYAVIHLLQGEVETVFVCEGVSKAVEVGMYYAVSVGLCDANSKAARELNERNFHDDLVKDNFAESENRSRGKIVIKRVFHPKEKKEKLIER